MGLEKVSIDDGLRLQRLAKAICFRLRLNKGDELVYVLGNGDQEDNIGAVSHWLIENNLYPLANDTQLDQLAYRLRSFLEDQFSDQTT